MEQLTILQNEANWGLILTIFFIVLIAAAFIYVVSYLFFEHLDGQVGRDPVDAESPVLYDPTIDSWN